ncbi:MAG: aspartate-semialdehyde dehydrogenase [Gammaproteobacteria bacterium]|nr:aspartate-semialdehyde dehydrogenase [Gammaproteobacteria bacterium]
MSKSFDVAVVGATGVVGESILEILNQRKFPIGNIYALASARSAGNQVNFGSAKITVEDLSKFDFSKVQIGLFSAGGSISKEFAPKAADAGCVVIDNTSHFRYENEIPLVVPEVNSHAIADYSNQGIIANPNCSTIQMLVALKPIYDAVGIKRINVCTYQAVSGAGKSALDELVRQTSNLLNGRPVEVKGDVKQIAFNAIPQIDVFLENRYTKEEMKMVWETHKILGDNSVLVNPTAVRIPVFFGHSEAIHIETIDKISSEAATDLLINSPGVKVLDGTSVGEYPTAVTESSGNDQVFVGRIREDISHPTGLNLWVVADNIRKGAALNSVQIAEILAKEYL